MSFRIFRKHNLLPSPLTASCKDLKKLGSYRTKILNYFVAQSLVKSSEQYLLECGMKIAGSVCDSFLTKKSHICHYIGITFLLFFQLTLYWRNPLDRTAVLQNVKSFTDGNLGVPLVLLIILAMVILPMPPFLLDVFFTFNIALSIVVLLVGVYAFAR